MSIKNYCASIVIVELHPDDKITIESLAVSRGECSLSGAWIFSTSEKQKIENVVSGKLVVALGDQREVEAFFSSNQLKYVQAKSFIQEARIAASDAIAAFEVFKSQDATKRKKMVEPSFFSWPENLDFNKSEEYLESIGKMGATESVPKDMRKTLATARLVKFFVEMWQLDEQERANRKYVEGADAEITILPESWLKEFVSL